MRQSLISDTCWSDRWGGAQFSLAEPVLLTEKEGITIFMFSLNQVKLSHHTFIRSPEDGLSVREQTQSHEISQLFVELDQEIMLNVMKTTRTKSNVTNCWISQEPHSHYMCKTAAASLWFSCCKSYLTFPGFTAVSQCFHLHNFKRHHKQIHGTEHFCVQQYQILTRNIYPQHGDAIHKHAFLVTRNK